MTTTSDDRQGIQSVEIAMTVLDAIERGRGLVAPLGSGRYDLGPAARRLGVESLRRMDEVGLASEHLPGLRDRTSHAVNLAALGWRDGRLARGLGGRDRLVLPAYPRAR